MAFLYINLIMIAFILGYANAILDPILEGFFGVLKLRPLNLEEYQIGQ